MHIRRMNRTPWLVLAAVILFVALFACTASAESGETLDGIYAIMNYGEKVYLSYSQNQLTTSQRYSSTSCLWHVAECHPDYNNASRDRIAYYIEAYKTSNRLDIPNANVYAGNNIQLCNYTSSNAQNWFADYNAADGTYYLASVLDKSFVLTLKNGKLQIQKKTGAANQKWILQDADRIKYIYSDDGTILLEVPKNLSTATNSELTDIANRWSKAYRALSVFHSGYRPFKKIIFYFMETNPYYAFVWGYADNHVYVNSTFLPEILNEMKADKKDFGFFALHEMGHLFDSSKPWSFDTEILTDLRLVYTLDMNRAKATLGGRKSDASTMKITYRDQGHDVTNIFYIDYMLLQIKDAVGWLPFIETFAAMDGKGYASLIGASSLRQFDTFINILSEFAGTDVRQFVNKKDYDAFREYLRTR